MSYNGSLDVRGGLCLLLTSMPLTGACEDQVQERNLLIASLKHYLSLYLMQAVAPDLGNFRLDGVRVQTCHQHFRYWRGGENRAGVPLFIPLQRYTDSNGKG